MAGRLGVCSIIHLTVSSGLRRLASAKAAFASSILPACAWAAPSPRLVAHQGRADHVDGENRGRAAGGDHYLGTPALRMPSKTGSSWARYVGSSLNAV